MVLASRWRLRLSKRNSAFRRALLAWYEGAKRDLPWRRTSDPYAIWISEIMLQQTRVAAAVPFYERFMARFPTVESLAIAPEADVLSHWAGLGYYSRARNLHKAAKILVAGESTACLAIVGQASACAELQLRLTPSDCSARGAQVSLRGASTLPDNLIPSLLSLPGIGDYTAAAIASIAFQLPVAAVDGNLLRVIARLDNDASDIGHPGTRARFTERTQSLLDPNHPGAFNQAMMELGATICVPKSPRCGACPVSKYCEALKAGRESELPVKGRKQAKVNLDVTVLVIERAGKLLLRQRGDDVGQMAGFWELPAIADLPQAVIGRELGEIQHTITHHHYRYRVHLAQWSGSVRAPFAWRKPEEVLLSTAAKKALRCLEH